MPQSFNLAMVQMAVRGGDLEGNLTHALELINEAAQNGAQFVLLPECMDIGWTCADAPKLAAEIPSGKTCQSFVSAAKLLKVYICAGITERDGDKVYNAAVLISPHGEVILKHRKIHELDIAHGLYSLGNRINVMDTEFGRIGLMICADATAPDHTVIKALCAMGAEVILSPTSWAVDPDFDNEKTPYGWVWDEPYAKYSKEHGVAIAGVSNVGAVNSGPWNGYSCIGCSKAYNASGEHTVQGPYGSDAETILYTTVEPKPHQRIG